MLDRTKEIVPEPDVRKMIEDLAGQKKPELAALLLLQIAKAEQTVRSFKKGHVAVGRVVVEDGKLDPELVLAQMEILPEGYFAGEVGDLERPLCFRPRATRKWTYLSRASPAISSTSERSS